MAKEHFTEGIASQKKIAELVKEFSQMSPEEFRLEKERVDREEKLAFKLVETTRKEHPGFRDTKKGQLLELCRKAITPRDEAYCMICHTGLEYQGNDKKCKVYCPECGVDIEFTDLNKFKAETTTD